MKKRIKILLIVLVVVELISTYFMYKSSQNKKIVLDLVELKDSKYNDKFALYIDGREYSGTTWPVGVTFDATQSKCINEKGDMLSNVLSFSNNKVGLSTDDTTYCYLYFVTAASYPKPTNCDTYCDFKIEDYSYESNNVITFCPALKLNTYGGTVRSSSISSYTSGCVDYETYTGKYTNTNNFNATCEITFVKATGGKCPDGYTQYLNNKDYCYIQGEQTLQIGIGYYAAGIQESATSSAPGGSYSKFIPFDDPSIVLDVKQYIGSNAFATLAECEVVLKKVIDANVGCYGSTSGQLPGGGTATGGYSCQCGTPDKVKNITCTR